jgi:hypothetical protein
MFAVINKRTKIILICLHSTQSWHGQIRDSFVGLSKLFCAVAMEISVGSLLRLVYSSRNKARGERYCQLIRFRPLDESGCKTVPVSAARVIGKFSK